MALADVDEILVKGLSFSLKNKIIIKVNVLATCVDDTSSSSLASVSLDYAEPYGSGELALDVEQCRCPEGYVGPSCEVCFSDIEN